MAGQVGEAGEARHPIQVVSQRTGLSVEILRVWEKRYRAVTPARTGAGRRLYADQDVERLLLLRRVTEAGRRIGEVAGLSRESLLALAREDDAAREARERSGHLAEGPGASDAVERFRDELRVEMDALNPHRIRNALERAYCALGGPLMIERVLAPFLREIGERWHRGKLDPAAEHMASAVARAMLGEVLRSGEAPRTVTAGCGMVVSTLEGERHEIGAMMAATVAAAAGWRVTYLGPDLPAEQVAGAASRTGADAVALSVMQSPAVNGLPAQLVRLRSLLSPEVAILLGGPGSSALQRTADQTDAILVLGVAQLADVLSGLERRRPAR